MHVIQNVFQLHGNNKCCILQYVLVYEIVYFMKILFGGNFKNNLNLMKLKKLISG